MTDLFKDMLSDEESLFKDEFVLDFDYLPDLLPYRENQQKYIAEVIKPLASDRQSKSLFINGKPGIGKTACVRYVFKELKEATGEIKPVFINCWQKSTTNAILGEIAEQIGAMGARYKTNEELWAKIEEAMGRCKGVVIALDEVDKAKEHDIFYQAMENLKQVCMLLITNGKEFIAEIEPRVKSRMNMEELEFLPYKRDEMEGILKERRDAAFVPGVWSDEAFQLIVDKAAQKEDARVGIFLLRETGRNAEKEASRKIKVEHAIDAISKVAEFRIESSIDLDEREKAIFAVIKENPGIETGELVEELRKRREEMPDSTARRLIQRLDKGGYIFREESVSDKGRTMKHYVDE